MRQERFDEPGTFHHLMWHALPNEKLFRDDLDRQRYLQELALVASTENVRIIGHSEMDTHSHIGAQAGETGISPFMQRLGRRYAGAFNRRHERRGPIVWDRFRSKLVQEEGYLHRLVRYIHRNPVKAGIVTLAELHTYPWTGHSTLLGRTVGTFMESDLVLSWFGTTVSEARRNLVRFMSDPSDDDDESFGGITDPAEPRSNILGDDDFAEAVLERANLLDRRHAALQVAGITFESALIAIAARVGTLPQLILDGTRTRQVSLGRALFVYFAASELRVPRKELGARLAMSSGALTRQFQRGRAAAAALDISSLLALAGSTQERARQKSQ